jgi:hypothetical protein
VSELIVERDRLREQIGASGAKALKDEFEQVGREVSGVLEQARQAAEAMRERAGAEAARWRSEAMAESESELRQARADAEQLRGDAWSTAEELLAQSQREATRVVDQAKAEALRMQGESERESHRLTSAARRQADEVGRVARMEAERLTIDAQARHDEIIETAARQSETAQERTRALEQRRDELKKELDTVRGALASMEAAMDERRERLGLSPSAPSTEQDEERHSEVPAEHWVPGETVRVVRPDPAAVPEDAAGSRVQRLADGPEIKLISAEELKERQQRREFGEPVFSETREEPEGAEAPEAPEGPEPAAVAEEPEDTGELEASTEPEVPAGAEVAGEAAEGLEVIAPESVDEARQQSFDDLVGLFERLRTDRVEPAPGVPPSATEPGVPEQADSVESETQHEAIDDQPGEVNAPAPKQVAPGDEPDPFSTRDQLLLPVSNRALRNLKRQLAEEGNVALEELHQHPDEWAPDVDEVKAKVRADLVVLHAESFGAGHAAAERLTGRRLTRPATPKTDVAAGFSADLVADIEHALTDGRAAGQGAIQLKASVARVFRAWRTDESERRMRGLSLEAFNEGVKATLGMNEIPDVRWVLAGRGCSVCRSLAAESVSERIPPAHSGCECMVAPG